MTVRRFLPLLAFASLLVLSACQEQSAQQSTTAAADSFQRSTAGTNAMDTSMTARPRASTSSMNDTSATRAGSAAAGRTSGGIDTTGPGPATIPQSRYTTTASGLKYYDLQQGSGASPSATDRVRVHYTGWLKSNGKKFDSSYDRGQPATFPLNGVIKGWTEGLQSMKVGGKRQLVVPPDLGYGQKGAGAAIPPGATLVFDVKLLGVEGK